MAAEVGTFPIDLTKTRLQVKLISKIIIFVIANLFYRFKVKKYKTTFSFDTRE